MAVGATLVVIVIAYRTRGARKDRSQPAPSALPSNVNQQLQGYTFTRSDSERQIFTIHAARTVALKQGGTTMLEDVVLEVFGRQGDRHDVLRTHLAEYNPVSGDFSSDGPVEIELNADLPPGAGFHGRQPAYLETSQVAFQQRDSRVVTSEPLRFKIGLVSGSARGMTYATKEGWLELENDLRVELPPAARNATLPAPNPGSTAPPQAAGGTRLSARRLRYDKRTGEVALWGPLEITQGNRGVVAGRGTISLDRRNRLTEALLEDGVRGFETADPASPSSPSRLDARRQGESLPSTLKASARRVRESFDPASGQLRKLVATGGVQAESWQAGGGGKQPSLGRLAAEQLEMAFEGVRSEPESATASGNVRLSLSSSAPAPAGNAARVARPSGTQTAAAETAKARQMMEAETMTAAQMVFSFRPEDRSLEDARTAGPGELVLVPQDPKQAQQKITAGQFVMSFDNRSRLQTLSGLSGVRVVSLPRAGAPAGTSRRESSSERLEATFDPSTAAILSVVQSGNFRFSEGERQGSAERAEYSSQAQAWSLTGHPQAWDPVTRLRAERFLEHLDTDTLEGIGNVQSTHLERTAPASRPPKAGAVPKAGATPRGGDTTNVLADRVLAARSSRLLHYEGHVRAWRGADVVEASSLDYNAKERRLSSGFKVVTSHLASPSRIPGDSPPSAAASSGAGGAGRAPEERSHPLSIRADRLEFFDAGRKASYRGDVELETESTKLQADRMDVYFSAGGAADATEVSRVLADGHVLVTQPGRRATGNRLEYEAARGKIVILGGPPALYDEDKGFTTGQSLTFFIHDDRLLVEGGEKSRALSEHRLPQ